MLKKISNYLPNLPSLTAFLPNEKMSKKIVDNFKSGTFFFFMAMGSAGAALATLLVEEGKEAEDNALLGMGIAGVCIIAGLILGMSTPKRPKKKDAALQVSLMEKPQGIANGGNTCFINALFQTFVNDQKLSKDIETIGNYSIEQQQNRVPWHFVIDTLKNFEAFQGSLSQMRAFALDERTKQDGVMGDPHELLQGMLKGIDSTKYESIPDRIKPFYFEEKRVIQWKDAADQAGLEKDNAKTEGQIKKDFSLKEECTNEVTPAWCFSVDMQEKKTLSQLLDSYFQAAKPKDVTTKKVYDANTRLLRVENILEHVEFGEAKPSRFFLHTKRFIKEASNALRKIATPLLVEESFYEQLKKNTNAPYKISLQQGNWKQTYTLQSIILHTSWGETIERGHYTALVRNNGVWWVCDDSNTHLATKEDILKYLKEGYLYQFNLEEPVQEAGQIIIGNINEEPDHQNHKGNDQTFHRLRGKRSFSHSFYPSEQYMSSV